MLSRKIYNSMHFEWRNAKKKYLKKICVYVCLPCLKLSDSLTETLIVLFGLVKYIFLPLGLGGFIGTLTGL